MTFQASDVLVPWDEPWTNLPRYWVQNGHTDLNFVLVQGGVLTPDTFKIQMNAAAPNPANVFVKPRDGTDDRTAYVRLQSYVGQHLAAGPRSLKRLLRELQAESGMEPTFVEGCLRTMVAQQDLLVSGAENSVQLRLSEISREQEHRRAYVSSFAHELASQAEQIGLLIGHNPTIGSYREDLLRNLLQRHIPQRFHAATGFIAGLPGQIDILIYDQLDYAPLFRAGDLVVVPGAAVRAVIEVKSNLTTGELKKSLEHLEEVTPHRGDGPPIFTGVFAYDGATAATLIDGWRAFHAMEGDSGTGDEEDADDSETEKDIQELHLIDGIGTTVTAICVLRKTMLLSTYVPVKINAAPALTPALALLESFARRRSEAAVFFDILSRYLRHPFEGQLLADGIRGSVFADSIISFQERAYGEQLWGPYMLGEPDGIEDFESDLQAYERWLNGQAWSRGS